jgi:pimeloyl-ACP methyl ester carboxylesterase
MSPEDISQSPCIIYCHGNAGNKIDIIEIFDFLLWDFNICSFDFSGAGNSEGDYVTLGFKEKDDIKSVVNFLRNELHIKKIIIYGRSMGAVSALRYAVTDPTIKAIVLDSPFSNFHKLCADILLNKFYMPSIISSFLINLARNKILTKIKGFDIK